MESTSPTASASAAGRSRPSRSAWCCSGLRTPRTDTGATPVRIVERYTLPLVDRGRLREGPAGHRRGEARNREEPAGRRTMPFGLLCQSLLTPWYATSLHAASVLTERRRLAPWLRRRSSAFEGSQRPGARDGVDRALHHEHPLPQYRLGYPISQLSCFLEWSAPVGVAWSPITRKANLLLIARVQLNIMEPKVGIEPTT